MLKGPFGVTQGTIETVQIVKLLIDLIEGKIGKSSAIEKMKRMDESIREELRLLEYVDGFNGEERVIISEPKEWYIHNFAKAETRGAIIESILSHFEKQTK